MKKNKDNRKKIKFNKKRKNDKNSNVKWIIGIVIWSFILSACISSASDAILSSSGLFVAIIILVIIILIGVVFDIIGVAVTAADETPFHSMASRKKRGAKTSVNLIRNANRVASFCNDVIGDVCGVISGGAGAVIIVKIITSTGIEYTHKAILTIAVSAIIASVTVGGKAIGKNFAINQSNNIVYSVAWLIEIIRRNK